MHVKDAIGTEENVTL